MEYMEKVSLISQLSERKQKFNKLFKNEKNKEQLYKWLKSELAYTSNNIEGNTLTRKETRLVIEEDINACNQHHHCYHKVHEADGKQQSEQRKCGGGYENVDE